MSDHPWADSFGNWSEGKQYSAFTYLEENVVNGNCDHCGKPESNNAVNSTWEDLPGGRRACSNSCYDKMTKTQARGPEIYQTSRDTVDRIEGFSITLGQLRGER